MPADKVELIQYLSDRIKQAEVFAYNKLGRFIRYLIVIGAISDWKAKDIEIHRRKEQSVVKIVPSRSKRPSLKN